MSLRSNVSPSTLDVETTDEGVAVHYLDGRRVVYRTVPETVEGTVQTPPGKEVHVLVTDSTETAGVVLYVNDLKTHDDILESTGVGRLVLDAGESSEPFPGVVVSVTGHRVAVDASFDVVDGRVFVFAEDEFGERAYELVDET